MNTLASSLSAALILGSGGSIALAETPPASQAYTAPFGIRGAPPLTTVRSDNVVAAYQDGKGDSGATVVSLVFASWRLAPELCAGVRIGYVHNDAPGGGSGSAVTNPILSTMYSLSLPLGLRLSMSLGLGLPVGSGGGNTPDTSAAQAQKSGILARSAMDSALFAVDDWSIIPGADLAWVLGDLTLQLEATLAALFRGRGERVQPDSTKLNSMTALHAGYRLFPIVSLAGELRFQHWLAPPKAASVDPSRLESQASFAIGPRFHLELADGLSLHPGLSYGRGIGYQMDAAHYQLLQIDVPVVF
jgi:hypothetical protein